MVFIKDGTIRLLGQEIYTYTFLYDVSQIELLSLLYLLLFYLFTGGLGPGHEVHPTDTERREHGRLLQSLQYTAMYTYSNKRPTNVTRWSDHDTNLYLNTLSSGMCPQI